MVKGVNKTVIEVNNTGSKLFEKIVFYVTPEFGHLNAKQLRKEASLFTFKYGDNAKGYLRRKRILKRRIFIASCIGLTISIVLSLLLIFL